MCFKNLFKIPSINVRQVDEYFALPKKEREHKGLYRLPFALPADIFSSCKEKGWSAFYTQIKQEYPIQFFFRHWLFSLDNPVYLIYSTLAWKARDTKYAIKNFIKPNFPRWRSTLPRHKYADITHIVVESNFNLILDFYYDEATKGIVDWNYDKLHKTFFKQLKKNVEWIEKTRLELDKKATKELTIATNDKTNKPYLTKYKKHDKIEKTIRDKETEIIHWFVENRNFFWT